RPSITADIERWTEACVDAMGDIFWDYQEGRDRPLGFHEPRRIAEEAVRAALAAAATALDPSPTYSTSLQAEYRGHVAEAAQATGDNADEEPTDDALLAVLVNSGEWTPEGAATILHLACQHGVFTLSNALALAAAQGIEDGANGL
ncbi:MAG: hypothetical protein K2Q09_08625, partial [Phycisphaerales bacterium]|nr:hypothetical protein [Phycisphaerales bacterium]